ncbi:DUF6317 family protein [Actinokineospora fastidiosa]|uniref:Excreted virulence factor EspC, type VII ESX diderm n=1 Tax=Actinokineospora fastidiosa TaxID=1816 RepID=A0A918G1Z1_9PSEU|nr:hypothetical protein [Actinokineospora fastidiosa]GGS15034.1 hypothetical protein GCM10010171_03700 [Actinokineospora fastidiosa]
MGGFTARVDSLREAASAAGSLGEELRARAEGLLTADTGDPGHAGLAQEMRAFAERLRALADGFTDEVDSIGERLTASAAAYTDTDGEAAGVFTAWLS